MDDIDRAQALEEAQRQDALDRVYHGGAPREDWQTASAKWCDECGDRIPDARRRAVPGTQLCAACQSREEHRLRQRRQP